MPNERENKHEIQVGINATNPISPVKSPLRCPPPCLNSEAQLLKQFLAWWLMPRVVAATEV